MNQKRYSVLLCALLASSFYHEICAKTIAKRSLGYGPPNVIVGKPAVAQVGQVVQIEQAPQVAQVAQVSQAQAIGVNSAAAANQQISTSYSSSSSHSESSSYSVSQSYSASESASAAYNAAAAGYATGYGGVYQPVIDGNLKLYSNPASNYMALYNSGSNSAAVFNINSNQVALLNGNAGYGSVLDLGASSGSYFTYEQSSTAAWQAQTTSFESYFNNLNNFNVFSGINGAVSYSSASASSVVQKSISTVVSDLWGRSGIDFDVNYQRSIDYTMALSSQFITTVKGFNGLPAILGTEPVTLGYDYPGFVNALQGFGILVNSLPSGFDTIRSADYSINYHNIFGATNGVEALTQYLYQINPHYDLGVYTSILNNPQNLFNLMVKLGGNVNWGTTGALKIILGLTSLDASNDSLYELLTVITEFSAATTYGLNSRLDLMLTELQNLLFFNKQKNYGAAFSGLSNCINGFRDRSLIINKINVVEIIDLLIDGVRKGPDYSMPLIASLLFKVRNVIDINVSVPALVVSLLLDLNNPLGLDVVKNFGWNLDIAPQAGNILPQFINVDHIAPLINSSPYSLLTGLPVVSNVMGYINDAFAKVAPAYDINFSLKSILNQNKYFPDLLNGVFRQVGFVLFPASRPVLSSVQNIAKYTTSLESVCGLTNSDYAFFNGPYY
ncbi:hypothetical protein GWI33_004178 [Rhynchophorus ferrugineus]|uniref:Uncharacterized protein n=1 Tax=Rhynchophorus ferrugineus TaxID=354439 RepID=A0A834MKL9_RHYFE|nr:hypothetical protein GWI33_004178 [Rhynchophorus ferrugineus]